jgi:nitroimidazol reductase NimA-like FMN-containing flavoprotein (pyridoxamine 5'-phosphate oxidase superfamily)
MSTFHNDRAVSLLKNNLYMAVGSSSSDAKPLVSPVYFSFDKDLNFYWTSDKQSRHSQNVHENANVYLVIYNLSARGCTLKPRP